MIIDAWGGAYEQTYQKSPPHGTCVRSELRWEAKGKNELKTSTLSTHHRVRTLAAAFVAHFRGKGSFRVPPPGKKPIM